jgi:hypothetical protein
MIDIKADFNWECILYYSSCCSYDLKKVILEKVFLVEVSLKK